MTKAPKTSEMWLKPSEALRVFVRAALPGRPDVAEAIDELWFRWPKTKVDSGFVTAAEFEATKRALHALCEELKAGAIAAAGRFNGEGPDVLLSKTERAEGRLDFWNCKLNCSDTSMPPRHRPMHMYFMLRLNPQDVDAAAKRFGHSETTAAGIAKRRSDPARAKELAEKHLEQNENQKLRKFRQVARDDGWKGAHKLLDDAYHARMKAKGRPVKRGRPGTLAE